MNNKIPATRPCDPVQVMPWRSTANHHWTEMRFYHFYFSLLGNRVRSGLCLIRRLFVIPVLIHGNFAISQGGRDVTINSAFNAWIKKVKSLLVVFLGKQ